MTEVMKKAMEKVEKEVIENPDRSWVLRSNQLTVLVNMVEKRFNLLDNDEILVWQALCLYGLMETVDQTSRETVLSMQFNTAAWVAGQEIRSRLNALKTACEGIL